LYFGANRFKGLKSSANRSFLRATKVAKPALEVDDSKAKPMLIERCGVTESNGGRLRLTLCTAAF